MSMLKTLESNITIKEKLASRYMVVIKTEGGADVRSDRHGFRPWRFERAHADSLSLSDLQRIFRFEYPGFTLIVIDQETGSPIHGRTLLQTLRESE